MMKALQSNGFRKPYQVLADSRFLRALNKQQGGVARVRNLLRDEPRLLVPKCQYELHKKFGKKEGDVSGCFEILKCEHGEDVDCIAERIGDKNRNHYILGTGWQERVKKILEHPMLPFFCVRNGQLAFEIGKIQRIIKVAQGKPATKSELRNLRKMLGNFTNE